MPKYVVTSDAVGVAGEIEVRESPTRRARALARPKYYRRGQTVEMDQERGDRLVKLGHLKPENEVEEGELEPVAAPAPDIAPNEPADAPEVDPETGEADFDDSDQTPGGQKLTEKQQLQAEARELDLDDSGTTAELKARIAEKKG